MTIRISGKSSLSLHDIERCHSPAQVTHLIDLFAQKLSQRLGSDLLSQGLILVNQNAADHSTDLVADFHIIPLEYGNDVLRFAQDVIKAHEEQQRLDSAS